MHVHVSILGPSLKLRMYEFLQVLLIIRAKKGYVQPTPNQMPTYLALEYSRCLKKIYEVSRGHLDYDWECLEIIEGDWKVFVLYWENIGLLIEGVFDIPTNLSLRYCHTLHHLSFSAEYPTCKIESYSQTRTFQGTFSIHNGGIQHTFTEINMI